MGIGRHGLRKIPVDTNYQIQVAALESRIQEDIRSGMDPFCIVANLGTVNTGALDPLDALLDLAKKYKLWLHIDGAFGALAKMVPDYEPYLKRIHEADSIAFDLHKWMYLPYECGCLLVKNKSKHRDSFAYQPDYLLSHERGLAAGPDPIGNYGLELSRGFKALKVWFCFQEYGKQMYSRLIRQNIVQCLYLADQIIKHPALELMAPVPLNIVCFRYNPGHKSREELNQMNKEILMQLHEKGIAAPSSTILSGHYVIRVAHVNHRSRRSDFDALLQGVLSIGAQLS
jgi:aromatic-L-amino-acid/L-tryptophan decarboxylase